MPRRKPRIDLSELAGVKRTLNDLPQDIRRAQRAALNDQARDSKRVMGQRISRDGVSSSRARGQIQVRRATNRNPQAALIPTSRRIPYRLWDFTTRATDDTGTRHSVWIRKGGELMRVWGFVNPLYNRRRVLTRHRKVGTDRIRTAAGHSIKLHFQAAMDQQLLDEVKTGLSDKFLARYEERTRK